MNRTARSQLWFGGHQIETVHYYFTTESGLRSAYVTLYNGLSRAVAIVQLQAKVVGWSE